MVDDINEQSHREKKLINEASILVYELVINKQVNKKMAKLLNTLFSRFHFLIQK
jgi:hypothetical protein